MIDYNNKCFVHPQPTVGMIVFFIPRFCATALDCTLSRHTCSIALRLACSVAAAAASPGRHSLVASVKQPTKLSTRLAETERKEEYDYLKDYLYAFIIAAPQQCCPRVTSRRRKYECFLVKLEGHSSSSWNGKMYSNCIKYTSTTFMSK